MPGRLTPLDKVSGRVGAVGGAPTLSLMAAHERTHERALVKEETDYESVFNIRVLCGR